MFLKELDIKDKDNIIALALFGSYNTEQWIKYKSDIDILVLLNERKGVSFEFELEDKLIPLLEKFYKYDNIQLTFLYLNEFDSIFAKCYIESKDKVIFDINKEIDFRLYVNKYLRNNEWLNSLIKEDTGCLERDIRLSPYYINKKERLEKKFYVAKDTLSLLRGAMKEFNNTNSIFLYKF